MRRLRLSTRFRYTLTVTLFFVAVGVIYAQENRKEIVITNEISAEGESIVHKWTNADNEDLLIVRRGNGRSGRAGVISRPNPHNVFITVQEEDGVRQITVEVDGEKETFLLGKGERFSEEQIAHLRSKGIHVGEDGSLTAEKFTYRMSEFKFDPGVSVEGMNIFYHPGKSRGDGESFARAYRFDHDAQRHINCVALGVYVSTATDRTGARVSGTIRESGAEASGLARGDKIVAIEDMETMSVRQLHEALGKFEPGDVVTVTFEREGNVERIDAALKAWRELPEFVNRRHATVTCDDTPLAEEPVTREIIVIKKNAEKETPEEVTEEPVQELPAINVADRSLMLGDFTAFPNPTDGKFQLRFSADAAPVTVSIYDATGKEVYRERLADFEGYYNRELDMRGRSNGSLIISIEQDGRKYTDQIILH